MQACSVVCGVAGRKGFSGYQIVQQGTAPGVAVVVNPIGVGNETEPVRDRPQFRPKRVGRASGMPTDRSRGNTSEYDSGLPRLSQHGVESVESPHRQETCDAPTPHPDDVLAEQVRARVVDVGHGEQREVTRCPPVPPGVVVKRCDQPRVVTGGGWQKADSWSSAGHLSEVNSVVR